MMKKIGIIILALILCSFTALTQEQNKKVAVFDPAGEVGNSIKEIIREEISSVIVNTKGFMVLERQLINKVLEENKFQMGGLVDNSQISEIGKRMGAYYVLVSTVSPFGKNYYISLKMIEVTTAKIEQQKTGRTTRGLEDLVSIVKNLGREMVANYKYKIQEQAPILTKTKETEMPIEKTTEQTLKLAEENSIMLDKDTVIIMDKQSVGQIEKKTLSLKGSNIYVDDVKLKKNQIRDLMSNTPALKLYDSGKSKRRIGTWLVCTGILVPIVCTVVGTHMTSYEYVRKGDAIYENDYNRMIQFAVISGVTGTALIGTGIYLRVSGQKLIHEAVDVYNGNKKISSGEIQLSITGNSIGLIYNF